MQDKSANTLKKGLVAAALSALIAALVLATPGHVSQPSSASEPHRINNDPAAVPEVRIASTQMGKTYLPHVMVNFLPADNAGPEVHAWLNTEGVGPTPIQEEIFVPHLHDASPDHYEMIVNASDPSGVAATGIDTTGDGVIDWEVTRFPVYVYQYGELVYTIVSIDGLGNRTVMPITVTLTNEAPSAPMLVDGSLDLQVGQDGYAQFGGHIDPNNDPLWYILHGQLPEGSAWSPQTGVLTTPPQTAEAMFSGVYPITLTVAAWEAPHSHPPELSSEPITAEIRIVDHNPPPEVGDLWVNSDYPEKIGVGFHLPWDDYIYGRIHEVEIAIAQHPISDADWAAPGPDVTIYSLRELEGYTELLFAIGEYFTFSFDVGGGGTFYADARAIDAGGNVGPALEDDPSVVVQSLPESYVHYWTDQDGIIRLPYDHAVQVITDTAVGLADPLAQVTPDYTPEMMKAYLLSLIDGVNDPNGDNFELADGTQSSFSVQLNRVTKAFGLDLWIPDLSPQGGHLWGDVYDFSQRQEYIDVLLQAIQMGLIHYCQLHQGEFGNFAPGHPPYDVVPPW